MSAPQTTDAETRVTTVDVVSPAGTKSGTVELPPEVFDVQVNIPLIHQVVVAQLAAARQGTHDTKNRGEVRGGGRKPYRQKGTGRARQGSIRAPHYSGGGVVHGPTPRDYAQRTPKKMKVAALRGALSDRARSGRVHVVSGVVDGEQPSTRAAVSLLSGLTDRRHVLVVIDRDDAVSARSVRNVPSVHLLWADQLNTYDVLVSDDVVFTESALAAFLAGPVGRVRAGRTEVAPRERTVTAPVVAEPAATPPAVTEPTATETEPIGAEPAETAPVEADVVETDDIDTGPVEADVADSGAVDTDNEVERS